MNDPRVKYLTYIVTHGDWIEHEVAEPFLEKTDEYIVKIEDGLARLCPQHHYSTVEEAKLAAQDFVGQWNFESALTRDDQFKLEYDSARVIDCQPSPPPPGVVSVNADPIRFHFTTPARGAVTKGVHTYPRLPIGRRLAVDDPNVVDMMRHLTNYRHGRESLGTMANYCLTVVEKPFPGRRGARRLREEQRYRIDKSILDCLGDLSSGYGGDSARKVDGRDKPFNREQTRTLEMAVQALIRRVAELAKNPSADLPFINKENLELYAMRGVTEAET